MRRCSRERDATGIAVPKKPRCPQFSVTPLNRNAVRVSLAKSRPHCGLSFTATTCTAGGTHADQAQKTPGRRSPPRSCRETDTADRDLQEQGRRAPLKKFSLVGDRLEKQSATFLSRGAYHTAHLPFDQGSTHALDRLGELLQGLGPDQAIAIGHHKQGHESGTLRASASRARATSPDAEQLRLFAWARSHPNRQRQRHRHGGILEELYPPFGQVACLTRPSSSSGLYNARTGTPSQPAAASMSTSSPTTSPSIRLSLMAFSASPG